MKLVKLSTTIFNKIGIVRCYSFWHPDDEVEVIILQDGGEASREDFTGFGSFVTERGDRYEGEIEKGKKHGTGSWYYHNGDIYEVFTFLLRIADLIQGEWKNDFREGHGKLTTHGDEVYVGKFIEDGILGDGFVEYVRLGERYEGYFEDGKEHGEGKMYYENGDVYKGNFKFGRRHGDGVYFFGSGNAEFSGKFKWNNILSGRMKFFTSGVVFEGEFSEETGQPLGGKLILPNGHTFESDTFTTDFMPVGDKVKSTDSDGNVSFEQFSEGNNGEEKENDDL